MHADHLANFGELVKQAWALYIEYIIYPYILIDSIESSPTLAIY